MAFAVSIPMARVLGPEKLGYFNLIMWLTAMSGGIAGLGIPQTAGKFMAEFIGGGDYGMARAVYRRSLMMQTTMATAITLAALAILFVFGDPRYRLVSTIQILCTVPAMLNQIPTQANVANESMRTNMPGSLVSNLITLASVPLCLVLHWDLIGIATGMLLSRTADLVIRGWSTAKWVNRVPASELPDPLKKRMRSFALQVSYQSVLAMVIWDKSDLIMLKALSPDISQITFFTVAFNLAEKAVLAPVVFACSLQASVLAQYGRDKLKVPAMATAATRYLFLFSMPLLFGMAMMSSPLIRFMYGPKFIPAIPVLQCAAVLAILKPLAYPIDGVFRATGRQKAVLFWTTLSAILNIVLDYLLIPHLGAVGAALGSGIALSSQVILCLIIGLVSFDVAIDFKSLGRIVLAALAMAIPVIPLNRTLPPLAAILISPLAGAAVFILLVRAMRVLNSGDTERLMRLAAMSPAFLRRFAAGIVAFLAGTRQPEPVISAPGA